MHVIDSTQSNIMHFAKASGNREFKKALKKEICFAPEFAHKTQAIISALLGQSLLLAKAQGKKLIIVLGESHADYRGYQVEKMFMKAAKDLGINHLMVELPIQNALINPHEHYQPLAYGKNRLGMTIVGGDNNRGQATTFNTSKAGLQFRNLGTTDTVEIANQHMLLINGAYHLYGLISHDGTKLDPKKCFIVPVNLMPVKHDQLSITNSHYTESQFVKDPQEVIQFTTNGFDLKQISAVIQKQNNLKNFSLIVERCTTKKTYSK